uniref:Uncharacterized protein n=1 Tax=Helianthus annuus TaxID=4232 RepID=A0A251TJX2_HELAN
MSDSDPSSFIRFYKTPVFPSVISALTLHFSSLLLLFSYFLSSFLLQFSLLWCSTSPNLLCLQPDLQNQIHQWRVHPSKTLKFSSVVNFMLNK